MPILPKLESHGTTSFYLGDINLDQLRMEMLHLLYWMKENLSNMQQSKIVIHPLLMTMTTVKSVLNFVIHLQGIRIQHINEDLQCRCQETRHHQSMSEIVTSFHETMKYKSQQEFEKMISKLIEHVTQ
mmetsp:Transcript_3/g.6  ORF Transcript_3/g.6 Transcript_3/m.6 type:complete len:128 (-) Transcript_3:22-405(-)